MKKLEAIFVALTLLAFALSLNNIPFGATLSLLFSTGLIFACIGIGIKGTGSQQQGTSNYKALAIISYTIVTSLIVLAALFRFMFWPSAFYLTYLAAAVMLITFAVTLAASVKTKAKYYERLLFRNGFYFGMILILVLLPSRALVSYKYGNSPFYPAYVQVSDALNADPSNKELWQQQREAFRRLQYTRQYLDSVAMEKERAKR